MLTDKEIKKDFKSIASKDPDKYYATKVLKDQGYQRQTCKKCKTNFWNIDKSEVCGDPSCSGGFRFFERKNKQDIDYIEVWQKFKKMFEKQGYTAIKRYPVAARWREDTDFVQASIYNFQPWVVSGEVEPPANPLVVPQFCLRFNDIDNVGITGAHYTGFVMIGQHAFMPPKDWNQKKYFEDIHNWLTKGVNLKNNEITYHEDAWAGGGNYGPSMEYFSYGLELGNQVYMMYQKPKIPLKLNVLDMGMGHERNAWFMKGSSTSYEAVFPTVMKKLRSITKIKLDDKFMASFLPYSSYLNVDEVEDINKTWKFVAEKLNTTTENAKEKVIPMSALYSIADHTRSLLFALNDGILPSNTGGGYNLRIILRRALSFIDKYRWDIDLGEVAEQHAKYLKKIFPEVSENLDEVKKLIKVEEDKYKQTQLKSQQLIKKIINQDIDENKLLELYDSQGIPPELIKKEAEQLNKKITIPDDFYSKVASRHENKEQVHQTKVEDNLNLENLEQTEAKYFSDYTKTDFKAKIIKIIENKIILNQTFFYPTSGGQIHDIGTIENNEVVQVYKKGKHIVHVLKEPPKNLKLNQEVTGIIDKNRRIQLAQHHTSTHIVNAAAKKVLGHHINQAGAKKTTEKATIDITHYQALSDEEMKQIENEANKIIKAKIKTNLTFMSRTDAERKYGMEIYQGGVVPGKEIRIVEIPNIDVEACGGTHLTNTEQAKQIKILKSTKISDSLVRLTFVAGNAAENIGKDSDQTLNQIAELLNVSTSQIPKRAEELFQVWKKIKKAKSKNEQLEPKDFILSSKEEFTGNVLNETAKIISTQPEHILNTIKRFMNDLKSWNDK